MENLEIKTGQENKDQTPKLSQYARETLQNYTALDPEMVKIYHTIAANKEKFENETLINVPSKLTDQLNSFIKGDKNPQIIKLLKRAKFDYKSLLNSNKEN